MQKHKDAVKSDSLTKIMKVFKQTKLAKDFVSLLKSRIKNDIQVMDE